jgi:hypothetical protein
MEYKMRLKYMESIRKRIDMLNTRYADREKCTKGKSLYDKHCNKMFCIKGGYNNKK